MKRCLVIGGSGTLGREVCKTLLSQGARVALTFHTNEKAALAIDAPSFRLDLRDIAAIDRVVDQAVADLGGIDAMIHCAAVATKIECAGEKSHHRMPEVDEASWTELMNVNARSAFFVVRRLIAPMKSAGGGNIVLVGSVDGVKPAPSPVHYAASKAALAGMSSAMAKELGEFGIKVNVIAPGILEDGISRILPDNILKEYLKHCGLKRVAKLGEIAGLITWLATQNTYVTGRTIILDGAL